MSRLLIFFTLQILAVAQIEATSECKAFRSCAECATSPVGCDWCADFNKCTDDASSECRGDTIVAGVDSSHPAIHYCPMVVEISNYWDTFIHSGTSKELYVSIVGITDFMEERGFTCVFEVEGRVKSVTADKRGDAIACHEVNPCICSNKSIVAKLMLLSMFTITDYFLDEA